MPCPTCPAHHGCCPCDFREFGVGLDVRGQAQAGAITPQGTIVCPPGTAPRIVERMAPFPDVVECIDAPGQAGAEVRGHLQGAFAQRIHCHDFDEDLLPYVWDNPTEDW